MGNIHNCNIQYSIRNIQCKSFAALKGGFAAVLTPTLKGVLALLFLLLIAVSGNAQRTQLGNGPLKPGIYSVVNPLYYVDTANNPYWMRGSTKQDWVYVAKTKDVVVVHDTVIVHDTVFVSNGYAAHAGELTPEQFGAKPGNGAVGGTQAALDTKYGAGKYKVSDTWDYIGVNEMFRAAELSRTGAVMVLQNRDYYLASSPFANRKCEMPKVTTANSNGNQKQYVIYANGAKMWNGGWRSVPVDFANANDFQTFRTFNFIGPIEFHKCDTGFTLVGFHGSRFDAISSYDCQMAGYLAFGLNSWFGYLQTHSCSLRGWNIENWNICGDGQCQMNQCTFEQLRSYASGTEEYSFRFYGSSGIDINAYTTEGAKGSAISLLIDCSHKYSSFVKYFRVGKIHVETTFTNTCIYVIGGGGTVISFEDSITFKNPFIQTAGTFLAAKALTGETYVEVLKLFWNPGIKFRNEGPANGSVWWHLIDVKGIGNSSLYTDQNWEIDTKKGWAKPNPFSAGQLFNNSGSNRLLWDPHFTQ